MQKCQNPQVGADSKCKNV